MLQKVTEGIRQKCICRVANRGLILAVLRVQVALCDKGIDLRGTYANLNESQTDTASPTISAHAFGGG